MPETILNKYKPVKGIFVKLVITLDQKRPKPFLTRWLV